MHNIGKYGILSMVMKVKKNIYIITLILDKAFSTS